MRPVVMTFFIVPYACSSNTTFTSTSHEKSVKYIYFFIKKKDVIAAIQMLSTIQMLLSTKVFFVAHL